MVFVLCFMSGAPKAQAVLVLVKNLPETGAQAIVSSDRPVELGIELGTLSTRQVTELTNRLIYESSVRI